MNPKENPKILIITTPIRPVPAEFPPLGSLSVISALNKAGFKNTEFYPVPKVDSMTVKITPKNLKRNNQYIEFIRKSFSNPRKKILNSISMGLSIKSEEVRTLLNDSNIDEHLRPQHLNLDDWNNLYTNYMKS